MKEAKENEEADKQRKESADLNNEVDQLLFQTDKTLKDVKGKVSDDEIKKAEDARDALKKAKEDNNVDDMKAKKDDLNKIVQDLAVKLYQQQAPKDGQAQGDAGTQGGSTDGNGDGKGDDGTVDGDFHEVHDDDKK